MAKKKWETLSKIERKNTEEIQREREKIETSWQTSMAQKQKQHKKTKLKWNTEKEIHGYENVTEDI